MVTGQVQDAETGQPIEFVHVFIANTTIGKTTDEKGNFNLENLDIGEFDLVASIVGYELFVKRINIIAGQTSDISIKMKPQLIRLDEVEISSSKDRKWQRQLKKFSKEFLGSGPNARKCEILNPWVIDFEKEEASGMNIATADVQIEVLNDALGYKVYFNLKPFQWNSGYISFFGYTSFELLEPDSKEKEREWAVNRKLTYEGSMRHMFYAIANHRIKEEGFEIYQYNKHIGGQRMGRAVKVNLADLVGNQLLDFDSKSVVRHSIGTDQVLIDYYGKLEVIYKKIGWEYSPYPDEPFLVSTINFFKPVRCTSHGYVFDQLNYEVSGYFILSRLANMLPFEYGVGR
jgi:hypothetical protein